MSNTLCPKLLARFLEDLQEINSPIAGMVADQMQSDPNPNVLIGRQLPKMAGVLNRRQIEDLIPLIARHYGPEFVHRSYFNALIGGSEFHATYVYKDFSANSYDDYKTWEEYWKYELEQREKIAYAYPCDIHNPLVFRSDIHPMEYGTYLRELAAECNAFGIGDKKAPSCSTVTFYFEHQEDHVLMRIKHPELIVH